MNFFESQDKARHNTTQLLGLFAIAISFTIAGLYLAVAITIAQGSTTIGLWHPEVFFWVTVGTLLLVGSGSLWKYLALKQGGGAQVALSLGGSEVFAEMATDEQLVFVNVVEEMAIASGVPVPRIFVLADEDGINAFAAGFTTNDAAVAVTQGCLEQLDRDELQGVIAHEFSHILNGDMNLNLKLIGILQGILLIHLAGRLLMRMSRPRYRSRNSKGNPVLVLGFAMFAVGGIGWLCSRAIKAAVSRQREFLADASAVQFTRNPRGIASALQKIAGYSQGSSVLAPQAEAASHLFFGSAVASFGGRAFASHPPLNERIRRLGGVVQFRDSTPQEVLAGAASVGASRLASGFVGSTSTQRPPEPANESDARMAVEDIAERIGIADEKGIAQVRSLLQKLPPGLRSQLHSLAGAKGCVYALLLNDDWDVRDRQLSKLKETEPQEVMTAVVEVGALLRDLDPRLCLPVMDLAVPALRRMEKDNCQLFANNVHQLVMADGEVSLSEFALMAVLRSRLTVALGGELNPAVKFESVSDVLGDCLTLVAALAKAGHESEGDRVYAFQAGVDRLVRSGDVTVSEQVRDGDRLPLFTTQSLDAGLENLRRLAPRGKQAVVEACARTVLLDGRVTVEESELLRAFVLSLDCPLPPFLNVR
ncbi:MAG: M48 family metallopeptidase [Cyanobacteria bacterium P01_E01_bin.45]